MMTTKLTFLPLPPRQRDEAASQLAAAGLCSHDLEQPQVVLFAVQKDDRTIGYWGYERYGEAALFRSLYLKPDYRQQGYGRQIWQQAEALLRQLGIRQVYLLTDTATDFFSRLGFVVVARASAPPAIRQTSEFVTFCPSGSVCMTISLSAAEK